MVSNWKEKYTKIFREAPGERVKLLTDGEANAYNWMLDNPTITLREIGAKLGVSDTRVGQILAKGAAKLTGVIPTDLSSLAAKSKAPRKTPVKLTRMDAVKVTAWLVQNKDKVTNVLPDVALAVVVRETGVQVYESALKEMCEELGITLKVKPRFFSESQVSKTLAKELVRLCSKLGEPVSDELWELAGGKDEQN